MTRTQNNPVRYSIPLLLILTLCLFFAEHLSPWYIHNVNLDSMVGMQSGSLMRELAYIVMGTAGFIGACYTLLFERVRLRWNWVATTPLGLLLGWCALSLLWSAEPAVTAKRLCVLGLLFLGAFGVALSWTRLELLKFIALSAAIQVAVGFAADILFGYFTPWQSDYRFGGTLQPNSQAYVCLILMFSALCFSRASQRSRLFYLLLSACGLMGLMLTRSRSGLLALVTALILYVLIILNLRRKVFTALGIGVLALVVIISGAAPTLLSVLNRGGEGSEDFSGRGPLWSDLMTYASRHPVLGYGYENFWTISRIDDISSDQGWPLSGAHSGYIESLLQVGWIGAALHTLALLVCMGTGITLFKRTGNYVYFLSAALCLIYLVGGLLEGILIIKASEISYYSALLLCVMAVRTEQSAAGGARSSTKDWSRARRVA